MKRRSATLAVVSSILLGSLAAASEDPAKGSCCLEAELTCRTADAGAAGFVSG